jgi:hypothetical protein
MVCRTECLTADSDASYTAELLASYQEKARPSPRVSHEPRQGLGAWGSPQMRRQQVVHAGKPAPLVVVPDGVDEETPQRVHVRPLDGAGVKRSHPVAH